MNPENIGKAYDQITHLWTRHDFNRTNGIEQHKRALQFVGGHGYALDVGCGCTGRFSALLEAEGFTVEGVDISAGMLALARERQPHITFYHADICSWAPPRQYDVITAWDSIWHIPLSQQTGVITKLVNHLNPGGVLLFSFGGTDAPAENTDATMGPQVYYSTLGVNGFLALVAGLGCIPRHLEYDQHPELHTYVVVQKPG